MRESIKKWSKIELEHIYNVHNLTDREIGQLSGGITRQAICKVRKKLGVAGIKKRPYGKRRIVDGSET